MVPTSDEGLDSAIALASTGQYAAALNALERAVVETTELARAANLKIELLRRMGRLEEALEECRAAVALAPGEASYQQNLAVVLFDLGRDEEALSHAGELQDPAVQAAYQDKLGDLLRDRKRPAEALEQYQSAAALAPGEATYHLDIASALLDLDRVDEAMGHAADGIDLLPDPPAKARVHDQLGDLLRDRKRPAEALEQYQSAAALAPGEATYHLDIASALLDLDRVDEAMGHAADGIDLLPDPPAKARVHDRLGDLLREHERPAEALEECRAAVALAPGEASYQQNLAVVLFDLGRDEEALSHAGELQDSAVQAAYQDKLGDLLRDRKRPAEALEQYQSAAALAPGEATYHLDIASALLDLDRVDEAMGHAADGIDLLPDPPAKARVHDQLGGQLRGHERPAEALEHYRAAVALAPGEASYQQHLAVVLFDLGRDEEALSHAGELQDPAVRAAYQDKLGDLLHSHDRQAEALEQYLSAAALAPGSPGCRLKLAVVRSS